MQVVPESLRESAISLRLDHALDATHDRRPRTSCERIGVVRGTRHVMMNFATEGKRSRSRSPGSNAWSEERRRGDAYQSRAGVCYLKITLVGPTFIIVGATASNWNSLCDTTRERIQAQNATTLKAIRAPISLRRHIVT